MVYPGILHRDRRLFLLHNLDFAAANDCRAAGTIGTFVGWYISDNTLYVKLVNKIAERKITLRCCECSQAPPSWTVPDRFHLVRQ